MLKNLLIRQLAILFAFSFCSLSLAQNSAKVLSTYSCGMWVDSRARGVIAPSVWILGFLSGGNVFGATNNALELVDRESIFLWMDKYCKENPLEYIDDGGQVLLLELVAKRRNKK
jgi:hypothetical protein